jgi:hypothetical protein
MKSQKAYFAAGVVGAMVLACSWARAGQISGPHISRDRQHAVSLPLRQLGPVHASAGMQAQTSPLTSSSVLNFPGLATIGQGFSNANGAAGATQYVQLVNLAFAVYDKTTGTMLAGPFAENSLWSTFGGPCQTSNDGDGTVNYDATAGRWVFSHHAIPVGGPYLNCIAVSTTSDATGTYYLYAFELTLQSPDKPKLGIWPDAYYITQDLQDPSTKSFIRSQTCALDRTAMLAGTFAQSICFQGSISLPTFVPTSWDGPTPPPAGSPAYVWQLDQRPNNGRNTLNQFLMHVDFVNPQNATFTGPIAMKLPGYTDTCPMFKPCIPQPGTTNLLTAYGDRILYRIIYRNFGDHESVVMAHAVQQGPVGARYSAIRWYEIRTPSTPVIYQWGTFAPDTNSRWVPAIAMDKVGDIAVVYNVSSTTVFPSLSYTAWTPSDLPGQMEPESSMQAGGGSQLATNRLWSSMSSMTVDPSDDCTFWFTGQYYAASTKARWSTRIASFKFPSCH